MGTFGIYTGSSYMIQTNFSCKSEIVNGGRACLRTLHTQHRAFLLCTKRRWSGEVASSDRVDGGFGAVFQSLFVQNRSALMRLDQNNRRATLCAA